jgi:hypothetical protein
MAATEKSAVAMDTDSVGRAGESDNSAAFEKPVDEMTDDQYPHGLKLWLLTGASLAATFLISLDQVSADSPHSFDHV